MSMSTEEREQLEEAELETDWYFKSLGFLPDMDEWTKVFQDKLAIIREKTEQ